MGRHDWLVRRHPVCFSRTVLQEYHVPNEWPLTRSYYVRIDALQLTPAAHGTRPAAVSRAGVPREAAHSERRVALSPSAVAVLLKQGFKSVLVQRGAGEQAQFTVSEQSSARNQFF
jgi:hypothetical protein